MKLFVMFLFVSTVVTANNAISKAITKKEQRIAKIESIKKCLHDEEIKITLDKRIAEYKKDLETLEMFNDLKTERVELAKNQK